MYKGSLIALIAFLLLVLSGCTMSYATPNQLFSQPQLSEEQQNLKEMIKSTLPDSAILLAPNQGARKQTIHMKDLDGDRREEAVIFYKETNYGPEVKMAIFGLDDKWTEVAAYTMEGYELDYVRFAEEGNAYVGLANGDGQMKHMHVLQWEKGSIKEMDTLTYAEVVWEDLTDQKGEELVVIQLERNKSSIATLYNIVNGKLVQQSQASLDPYINGYINVEAGLVRKNRKGIWLDTQVGAHSGSSALLMIEDGELVNVFEDRMKETFKPHPVESRDVNRDGIIEMGTEVEPPGQFSSMAGTPWIQVYYQLDEDNQLQQVQRRYSNFGNGFYICFPSTWPEDVNILIEEHELTIVTYPDKEPLFHVRWVKREDWENSEDYTVLERTAQYIYEIENSYKDEKDAFHLWVEDF